MSASQSKLGQTEYHINVFSDGRPTDGGHYDESVISWRPSAVILNSSEGAETLVRRWLPKHDVHRTTSQQRLRNCGAKSNWDQMNPGGSRVLHNNNNPTMLLRKVLMKCLLLCRFSHCLLPPSRPRRDL
jgi:hypothetical protein